MITAVQTGKLDVDIHPVFTTFVEHKAVLSTWFRTFLHTREVHVFFLNTLKISRAQTPQERPYQGTLHTREQKTIQYT